MPKQLFSNNATSTLSGSLAQGGTTLVCSSGEGNRFPTPTGGDYFLITLFTKDAYATEQNVEVVKVTARAGDTMTIVRDVENLTGFVGGNSYNSNVSTVYIEQRWTAMGAGNTLQADDNLAALENAATARINLGLGNVNNTADADKPISTATQIALNGKAATGHTHAGVYEPADATILKNASIGVTVQAYDADLSSWAGIAPTAKQDTLVSGTSIKTVNNTTLLGSGNVSVEPAITAGTTGQYWRGDKTWQTFPTSGDASTNTATSVDSEVAVFSGTGGKTLKRATGSGIAKLTSGVLGTATAGTDFAKPNTASSWTAEQTFKEVKDTVFTITDAAGFSIDPANGSVQIVTIAAARTPVATNFEAGQTVLLGISGNFAITWTSVNPTWVKAGGTATAPSAAASGYLWVLLWKVGSTMYAAEVGKV